MYTYKRILAIKQYLIITKWLTQAVNVLKAQGKKFRPEFSSVGSKVALWKSRKSCCNRISFHCLDSFMASRTKDSLFQGKEEEKETIFYRVPSTVVNIWSNRASGQSWGKTVKQGRQLPGCSFLLLPTTSLLGCLSFSPGAHVSSSEVWQALQSLPLSNCPMLPKL